MASTSEPAPPTSCSHFGSLHDEFQDSDDDELCHEEIQKLLLRVPEEAQTIQLIDRNSSPSTNVDCPKPDDPANGLLEDSCSDLELERQNSQPPDPQHKQEITTNMSSSQQQQTSLLPRSGNMRTPAANKATSITNQTIQPRRQEKPRPLKISNAIEHHGFAEDQAPISIDEVLILMHNVNQAVKGCHFTSALASQIIRLHNLLKQVGEILEQNYKEELNRCFVSLRQACCRDSGALGTPCRIKIMELIELRAMGWKPNLSHSQYYVSRTQSAGILDSYDDVGPAPVSAPPFGSMMNPFGFHSMGPTAAHDFVSGNQNNPPMNGMHPPTQYFLIPAAAAPQGGFAFVAPNPAAAVLGPPQMPPPLQVPVHAGPPPALSTSPVSINVGQPWPKGAVMKPSGKYQRPYKVPGKNQFKDEVVIRNADSGKIMGIKGRRVAIIEEISKTIISFQKVATGAKERCLTITGPTEESIEQAKVLIENTIRRNASPDRENGTDSDMKNSISSGDGAECDENPEDYVRISAGDTELILSGADPEIIQQARGVLQNFLKQNLIRSRSKAETGNIRDERLERRKSMPPIAGGETGSPESSLALDSLENRCESPVLTDAMRLYNNTHGASQYKKAISTPNLAESLKHNLIVSTMSDSPIFESEHSHANGGNAVYHDSEVLERDEFVTGTSGGGSVVLEATRSRMMMRVVYTREFLLQCATSPFCQMQPKNIQTMTVEMPEIIRRIPGKFEPAEYKNFCQKLRQRV